MVASSAFMVGLPVFVITNLLDGFDLDVCDVYHLHFNIDICLSSYSYKTVRNRNS